MKEFTSTRNYQPDDNERVDCGHYEYLDRAVALPGGFLICAECHAKLCADPALSPALAATRSAWREKWTLSDTQLPKPRFRD
jgi:hypothetical protein